MKKLLLLITALSPLLTLAQTAQTNTFTIKGHADNLSAPARVYLLYQLGANKVSDSSLVVNGNFDFSGEIINPTSAYLLIDRKGVGLNKLDQARPDLLTLFLDKGEMTVTTTDSIAKAKITGSLINDENLALLAQIKPIQDAAAKINAEVQATPKTQQNTEEFQNQTQDKFKALQSRQQLVLQNFITTHPASYLSLIALNTIDNKTDPFEADKLYNSLAPALKETEAGKVIKQAINQAKITAIGVIAPDFTQNDENGLPVKLSSFKGKYVLIDFWASWCGPCRDENPNVVRIFNKYKNRNFTILGVSLDRPGAKTDWMAAIKRDGLTWTQVSDLKFWNNAAAQLYAVSAIPSNFLLDPQGKIIAKDLRGNDLDKKLSELLGKM